MADVLFNPMDPAFLADPYPTYERLRHEQPVYKHPAGMVAVSRYADVSYVLRNAELFSSSAMGGGSATFSTEGERVGLSGSLIGQDPPVHTAQRNIVNRGFTPRRMAALELRVRAVVDELIAGFASRGRCDLTGDFAAPLPVRMIAELLGLGDERLDDLKRWSSTLIVGSTSPQAMSGPDLFAAMRDFGTYMARHVEARRREPGEDLVSTLIHAGEEQGVLSPEEVVSFASLLLAAGSETTMNLIGNAVVALLENPEQRERVLADSTLVPQWLEESLRHDSPVQLLMRLTTTDVEIGGVEVPKGRLVMVLVGSANRDEEQFPDSGRFDVGRSTAGHLAFGLGNHFCLGAALARLEARVAFEQVLDRLSELELDAPSVHYHGSFLIRGPKELPVRFAA